MSAFAEEKDSTKKEAVPLEKKLDKRGLLNLGYGYGINGLDVGYIGGGHHGGAYHQAAPVIASAPFAHYYGGGGHHQSYGGGGHYQSYGGAPFYLGSRTDVHKTNTILKGVPVPYEVNYLNFINLDIETNRKFPTRSPNTFHMKSLNTSRTKSRYDRMQKNALISFAKTIHHRIKTTFDLILNLKTN